MHCIQNVSNHFAANRKSVAAAKGRQVFADIFISVRSWRTILNLRQWEGPSFAGFAKNRSCFANKSGCRDGTLRGKAGHDNYASSLIFRGDAIRLIKINHSTICE
jgi:hypothetical protein